MQKTEKIRGRIREVVSSLHRLDDELGELAESLPLPVDATEMWDSQLPASFLANLYAAVDAVRSDCIQDGIDTLLRAIRQSDVSLRRQFLLAEDRGRRTTTSAEIPVRRKTGKPLRRQVQGDAVPPMQRGLLKICADLREIDDRLVRMCSNLPKPTATFNAHGELRGTLECVRTDLLDDAISTLRMAAKRGCEAEWRYAFEQRAKLAKAADMRC